MHKDKIVSEEDMKPLKFTTEVTEKKNFRFFKSSVNSIGASSSKNILVASLKAVHKKTNTMRAQRGKGSDFLVISLYLNLFSAFSVVNFLHYGIYIEVVLK